MATDTHGTSGPTRRGASALASLPTCMCFVVEDGDRFLHSSWVTTTGAWTREIRAYLCPPQGDAYVYESFTRADARGGVGSTRSLSPGSSRR